MIIERGWASSGPAARTIRTALTVERASRPAVICFSTAGGPAGGYCTFDCVDPRMRSHRSMSRCVGWGPGRHATASACARSKDPAARRGQVSEPPRPRVQVDRARRRGGVLLPSARMASASRAVAAIPSAPRVAFATGKAASAGWRKSQGAPTGSRCTLTTDCDGRECIDRDENGVGTCTALCTLGSLAGCGFARDADERGAACVAPLISSGPVLRGSR